MVDKKALGERIKAVRILMGMTRDEFSTAVGMKPRRFAALENGLRKFIYPDEIIKISNISGVGIRMIYREERRM